MMSATQKWPPGLSTRSVSANALALSGTRLSTQLITTSTASSSTGAARSRREAELDVVVAQLGGIGAGAFDHRLGHVDADHAPASPTRAGRRTRRRRRPSPDRAPRRPSRCWRAGSARRSPGQGRPRRRSPRDRHRRRRSCRAPVAAAARRPAAVRCACSNGAGLSRTMALMSVIAVMGSSPSWVWGSAQQPALSCEAGRPTDPPQLVECRGVQAVAGARALDHSLQAPRPSARPRCCRDVALSGSMSTISPQMQVPRAARRSTILSRAGWASAFRRMAKRSSSRLKLFGHRTLHRISTCR